MLMDYPQSLTNADILGQGNLDLVREKSGKCQGILLSIICGNPVKDTKHIERNFHSVVRVMHQGKKKLFSEQGHVAYQIEGDGE